MRKQTAASSQTCILPISNTCSTSCTAAGQGDKLASGAHSGLLSLGWRSSTCADALADDSASDILSQRVAGVDVVGTRGAQHASFSLW